MRDNPQELLVVTRVRQRLQLPQGTSRKKCIKRSSGLWTPHSINDEFGAVEIVADRLNEKGVGLAANRKSNGQAARVKVEVIRVVRIVTIQDPAEVLANGALSSQVAAAPPLLKACVVTPNRPTLTPAFPDDKI